MVGSVEGRGGDWMAYVNLKKMPSPKKEYIVNLDNFTGGLNLKELEYRLGNNETPEIKNLWWRDGVLHCRDAQIALTSDPNLTFRAIYNRLWHGNVFVHLGSKLYRVDVSAQSPSLTEIISVGTYSGTFFIYEDKLYYKTQGYYIAISYNGSTFSYTSITGSNAYTPVTYINCDPKTGAGTVYQPENRLSSNSTLWYNAARTVTCEGYSTSSNTFVKYTPTEEEEAEGEEAFTVVLNKKDASATVPIIEEALFVNSVFNTPDSYTYRYYTSLGGWCELSYLVTNKTGISGIVTVDVDKFFSISGQLGTYTVRYAKYIDPGQQLEADFPWTVDLPDWAGGLNHVMFSNPSEFGISYTGTLSNTASFKVALSSSTNYDISDYGISFSGPLGDVAKVVVNFSFQQDYYFPLEVDNVTSVEVDGTVLPTNAYSKISKNGGLSGPYIGVHFNTAPVMRNPPINNTVKITYSKTNTTAYNNIMDCTMAMTYGGTGALAIVMAGSNTQPNAYFWNGQTSVSVDPTYFPMTQYQLAGDTNEPITGFGKQQGYLIIFKEGSVGRTSMDTQTVEGRLTIDLAYVGINAKIGCDLPHTIQLIENNLVWCNTQMGVHFLANTSAAYENNVICISDKVNDSHQTWTKGLLYDVRNYSSTVVAHDDERHYWLVVNGHTWLWDYYISNYKNPSWYYFDNIKGAGFLQEDDDIWEFGSSGRLFKFTRGGYSDSVGGAIDKVFRFPAQYFGTYDVKKNVESVMITMGSDTDLNVKLTYLTDLETRDDLTNLTYTTTWVDPHKIHNSFGAVFRRKPRCIRVGYFTMKMEDTGARDMCIVSAQIYYTYQGKTR